MYTYTVQYNQKLNKRVNAMNQMRNATKEGAQMQPAYTEYAHLYIL